MGRIWGFISTMRAGYAEDFFHSLYPKCCFSLSTSGFIFHNFGSWGPPSRRSVMVRSKGGGLYWLFLCDCGPGTVGSLGGPFSDSPCSPRVKVWERYWGVVLFVATPIYSGKITIFLPISLLYPCFISPFRLFSSSLTTVSPNVSILLYSSCLLTTSTVTPNVLVWKSSSVSCPVAIPESVSELLPSLLTVIPDAVVDLF